MAPIVVTVARDVAINAYAIDQQVHVLVLCIVVPRNQVLIVVQPHAVQVTLADLRPLRIAQVLARSGRQRDVQYRLAELRPQLADLAELLGEFARAIPLHIGVDQAALLFAQVVFERATEAAALDGLSDHRRPRRYRVTPGASALLRASSASTARRRPSRDLPRSPVAPAGSGSRQAAPVRRTARD